MSEALYFLKKQINGINWPNYRELKLNFFLTSILIFLWAIGIFFGRSIQGLILQAHSYFGIFVFTALLLKISHRKFGNRSVTMLLQVIPVLLWAIGDMGWKSAYFDSNEAPHYTYVIFNTTIFFIVAFILMIGNFLFSFEEGLFLYLRKSWKLLIFTIPFTAYIAYSLIFSYLFKSQDLLLLNSYYCGTEIAAILSGFVLLNLAILAMITAQSLGWSCYAASAVCIVLGDFALRVNKVLGYQAGFSIYSVVLLVGLYSLPIPIFLDTMTGKISVWNPRSIFSIFKCGPLLLMLIFLSIWISHDPSNLDYVKILCGSFGFTIIASVHFSHFLLARIETFGGALSSYLKNLYSDESLEKNQLELSRVPKELAHYFDEWASVLKKAHDDGLHIHNTKGFVKVLGKLKGSGDITFKNPVTEQLFDNCVQLINPEKQRKSSRANVSQSVLSIINEKRIELQNLNKNIKILFSPHDTIMLKLDQHTFKTVLSNLINNAIQAIHDAGVIKIDLEVGASNLVCISIKDSGMGIPADFLAKLNESGIQAITYGKIGGTGKGVAHAKKFLQGLGGSIRFDSVRGKGTTASIYLPLTVGSGEYNETINLRN